jgi:hypothetical protein
MTLHIFDHRYPDMHHDLITLEQHEDDMLIVESVTVAEQTLSGSLKLAAKCLEKIKKLYEHEQRVLEAQLLRDDP